jgi:hypothetical protein
MTIRYNRETKEDNMQRQEDYFTHKEDFKRLD